jgi:hypothetical protein
MWVLVLVWMAGPTLNPLSIAGFENEAACAKAYNTLKSDVTWGNNVTLIGKCVASK